jgi:hypothetical protein
VTQPPPAGSVTPVGVPLSGNTQAIATGVSLTRARWLTVRSGAGDPIFSASLATTPQQIATFQCSQLGWGRMFRPSPRGATIRAPSRTVASTAGVTASSGQLGDGTTTARLVPGPSAGLGERRAGRHGRRERHTCALVNGGAWCWGSNASGQLGDASTTDRWSPVAVQGLGSGVQAITAGSAHSCALTSAGAKCWGSNSSGELGNNSTTDSSIPVSVQGL